MKYKLLINGKNPILIKDFFQANLQGFDCLTTSSILEDIIAHINIFRPDAFLLFSEQMDEALISQLKLIKSKAGSDIPFIIACDSGSVEAFKKRVIELDAMVMPKSSPQLMEREIKRYFASRPAAAPSPEAPEPKKSGDDLGLGISLGDLMKSFDNLKHILVVDDDKSVLKMLKAALSDEYTVTTMVNGKMAEKFLETKNADLILLDYEMPEETGPEVLRKLRANEKSKNIPVVFLTGVADEKRIMEVLSLKPQGYLLKPIDMERLRSTIKNIIK